MADALPQLTPAFECPVDRCLFLFAVREACTLHLFGSSVEALGAYGVHRKEAECLRERYTIRPGVQKFNVRSHLPKNCTQSHFAKRSLGNRPFPPTIQAAGRLRKGRSGLGFRVGKREVCVLLVRVHSAEPVFVTVIVHFQVVRHLFTAFAITQHGYVWRMVKLEKFHA